jgi:hypothetical protein
MDKERKLALIDKFEDLSYGFDDVLELSDTIIDYKPFPDAWSIKEQIIHCLDFDAANFHRYRWGIAGLAAGSFLLIRPGRKNWITGHRIYDWV